jgi:hypothetical protein
MSIGAVLYMPVSRVQAAESERLNRYDTGIHHISA